MHVATLDHPAFGDDMDELVRHGGWLGVLGGIGSVLIAIMGALYPFVRDSQKRKGAVEEKTVDVSAIVAQQMQAYTNQMMARISSLEANEKALRGEFDEREDQWKKDISALQRKNAECDKKNIELTREVAALNRKVAAAERDNARLHDRCEKQSAEMRRMQKALDFTPLEVPFEHELGNSPSNLVDKPFVKNPKKGGADGE